VPNIDTDGGSSSTSSQAKDACPAGYDLCEYRCCPQGTQCVGGECRYPYSSAHLWVYLCPDFSSANCDSGFFQLDQMCSPVGPDAIGGTCYDTGLEVSAGRSYGLATCQECGSNCGRPASVNTPPGFLGRDWHSGFGWFCHQECEVPPSCGGRNDSESPGGSGGSGASGTSGGTQPGQIGGSSDGGVAIVPADAGSDAASSGAPGLCAASAAGECVKCTGLDDPTCGLETCCQLDDLAFCTDLTATACIGCRSDRDCDPGVRCCH
jgi:hypothetical protein